ncbi:NAD(P)/FAD-dependent oxidoreductase [Variovorax sp. YR216]|uniref:NAD(P)/FAD-dependent oxidoreductase n=1 Tax=Variovorax sp. YR216 TaxID=1882828 RepID=UPI00089C47D5|nr:NAD(P)/FAD-dependent oxidoreductase [Variovorax sp. YR216]SEB24392.1 Dehydrogenase (flavoprotein) [Variovorax sp. YR216]
MMRRPPIVDVAVVGAGPAGCATALALRQRGHSCLLIESAGNARVRVGETLPPAACRPLAALGVWDAFVASRPLPSVAIRSIWGSREPQEREFIFDPYGNGWHLDRARFDAMLLEQATKAGATLLQPARLQSAELDRHGIWALRIAGDLLRARLVVDASGRAASFARRQGAMRTARDHLIGVVARYRLPTRQRAEAGVMLLEAAQDGWWYGARLPNAGLVVSYMTDRDLLPRGLSEFESVLGRTEEVAQAVEGHVLDSPPHSVPADTACLWPMCGAGWLAVGDAAASYDPLSGQGIFKALSSGRLAADAISANLAGDDSALRYYGAEVCADFRRALALRSVYYAHEHRWPKSMFWHRRHAAADA